LFALASASISLDDEVTLQGSGTTFPAPLYKRWFLEYYQRPEVRVNYTPIDYVKQLALQGVLDVIHSAVDVEINLSPEWKYAPRHPGPPLGNGCQQTGRKPAVFREELR
jgi:hypothetical protein